MSASDPSADLPGELRSPAAYPNHPSRVAYLQTHISHLFFAGDLVYKVKKPVDLGFLDYTTLAARRHFCEEEVRLNRRLADDVYLGVTPIRRREGGGVTVGAGPGDVVDYAVEMRRLPEDRMLDHLIDRGDMDNERMRDLAQLLVEFHAAAATGPDVDEHGSLATVRGNCVENFEQTEAFTGDAGTISPTLHGFLRSRALSFVADHAGLFEQRVRDGRIREGHGDLHAGNICVLPDRIVIYDCIEFSRRFRCGDVIGDLAFLLMDMDLRRFRSFAQYFLLEYETRSGDAGALELVDFYKGYRAYVRGKVASLGLADLKGAERAAARDRAVAYFHLAATYELPPALVLCCGLPGSGKSFAAEHLARPFEAVVLNSDRTRKQLAGVAPTEHRESGIDQGLYGHEQTARTYGELLRLAAEHLGEHLGHGRTVVVDAGFRSRAQRVPFRELAEGLGVPVLVVHVDTAEDIVLARLAVRPGEVTTSDAGVEVYRAVADRFERPDEFGAAVVAHDGVSPISDLTGRVIDQLVRMCTASA